MNITKKATKYLAILRGQSCSHQDSITQAAPVIITPAIAIIAIVSIFASSALAQAVRFDSVASTVSGQVPPGAMAPLLAIPGSQITFCTAAGLGVVNTAGTVVTYVSGPNFTGAAGPIQIGSATYQIQVVVSSTILILAADAGTQTNATYSTLQGCIANPVTTYTTSTGGTPCAPTAQLTPATGGACVGTADNQGNFGVWVLAGQYYYYLQTPASVGGQIRGPYPLNIGASSGCPSNATCDANYATLAQADSAAGSGSLYCTKSWTGLTTHTYTSNFSALATCRLQPASGQVVTISGSVNSPATEIFDESVAGAGSVLLQGAIPGGVLPEWFSGSTLDVQLNNAIAALPTAGGLVVSSKPGAMTGTVNVGGSAKPVALWFQSIGQWTCSANPCFEMGNESVIYGSSWRGTEIINTGTGPTIQQTGVNALAVEGMYVHDLWLHGGRNAIKTRGPTGGLADVPNIRIQHNWIENTTGDAMQFTGLADVSLVEGNFIIANGSPGGDCIRVGAITNGETTPAAEENSSILNNFCNTAPNGMGLHLLNDLDTTTFGAVGWTITNFQIQNVGSHGIGWMGTGASSGCTGCTIQNILQAGTVGGLASNTYDFLHLEGSGWQNSTVTNVEGGDAISERYTIYWVGSGPTAGAGNALLGAANVKTSLTAAYYLIGEIYAVLGGNSGTIAAGSAFNQFTNDSFNQPRYTIGQISSAFHRFQFDDSFGSITEQYNGSGQRWVLSEASNCGQTAWSICSPVSGHIAFMVGPTSITPRYGIDVNQTSGLVSLGNALNYAVQANGEWASGTVATVNLPACTTSTNTAGVLAYRASVYDAVSPVVGMALTGGGGMGSFANVHCSLATGTYIVDGI